MSKRTRGSWWIDAKSFGGIATFTIRGDHPGQEVAHGLYSDERHKADARLIAAAPELLDALKGLLREAPTPGGNFESTLYVTTVALEAARAAIAKAEG